MLIAMQTCNRRLGEVTIEINDGINMDFDMESIAMGLIWTLILNRVI